MIKEKILGKYLVLFMFALLLNINAKETQPIKILEPQTNTVFQKNTLTVVVKIIDKNIDKIKIYSNNGTIYENNITKKRDTYCTLVSLDFGENTIFVRAYSKGKKRFESLIESYYKFPVYKRYKYSPKGYENNYFHTTKNEKACKKCHKMNSNEKKGFAFLDPKESNCYNCHQSLLKYQDAHAPAVNWVCSTCHEKTHSKLTKYPVPLEINKACIHCHKKFQQSFRSKKYKHDPVIIGICDRCHNPHSSPNKYFIRLTPNKLCTSCHEGKGRTTKKEGTNCAASSESSCVKCHNPHASDKPYFYEPGRQDKKKDKPRGLWLE